ncbi:MAG: MoxR family ATPase [Deltaproteobacteria bacterium]|nr:MoxR family ATPase [Deltaproteobacteria bacterium]
MSTSATIPKQATAQGSSQEIIKRLKANLEKVIRGKGDVIDSALVTLFSRGHLLLEDVPGVGKTTLAHSLARSIDASFQRIQFTSDLMPSDVIGVTIYNEKARAFEFRRGPIFSNIILADEINRATPKTQSALLEAMSEGQVSVDNVTYKLPAPFMILATQNPLEYSGTFPLPESQLDRFMLSLSIGYPDAEAERGIIMSSPSTLSPEHLEPVISAESIAAIQDEVVTVKAEEDVAAYIVDIVRATRTHKAVKLGVSTRGAMALFRASQAAALMAGRNYIIPDDVKKVALAAMRHRILPLGYGAEERGSSPALIIEEVLSGVNVPV